MPPIQSFTRLLYRPLCGRSSRVNRSKRRPADSRHGLRCGHQLWLTVTFVGSIALTRKNLGIMFFGGGTGARVVDIELDPVTEYEYLFALVKLTWLEKEAEPNR